MKLETEHVWIEWVCRDCNAREVNPIAADLCKDPPECPRCDNETYMEFVGVHLDVAGMMTLPTVG